MHEKDDRDPGASTQMFQAFFDRAEAEESGPRRMWVAPVGAAVVGLVTVFALAWLVVGG
jgi:hypothetical protein